MQQNALEKLTVP